MRNNLDDYVPNQLARPLQKCKRDTGGTRLWPGSMAESRGLLLGRLDRGLGLIRRQTYKHTVETLVGQRVFALALGYEDRSMGKRSDCVTRGSQAEAAKCAAGSISSMDLPKEWYGLDDDEQEGRFFQNAAGKLRPANIDGAAGADEVARIVARIRARWPKVRIVLADSGFCREELMAWCEAEGVDLFGLAPNARPLASRPGRQRGCAEPPARRLGCSGISPSTSWSRPRRVVGKAEHLPDANPRTVTSQQGKDRARGLYRSLKTASRNASSTCSPTVAGQPTAPVVRVVLTAAQRVAPDRAPPHPVCRCHLRHHPAEAVEDRCPGPS